MASWERKNWSSAAALFFLAVLGQTYVNWPISADWVFREGLKETIATTEQVRRRGEYTAAALDSMIKWMCFELQYMYIYSSSNLK